MMNIIYKDGTHEDLTLCLLTSGHEGGGKALKPVRTGNEEASKRRKKEGGMLRIPKICVIFCNRKSAKRREPDTMQLLTTSNFIGPWYRADLLFSGPGSIVLLLVLLFSRLIMGRRP